LGQVPIQERQGKVNCELDAKTRLEIASMVYNRWCKAYDEIKKVKALTWESTGKFCPKEEWPLYQKDMLENAEKELALALKLKDDVCKYSPLVTQEYKNP
jgi:hypothetical protein